MGCSNIEEKLSKYIKGPVAKRQAYSDANVGGIVSCMTLRELV
jgi:hypothetical protein